MYRCKDFQPTTWWGYRNPETTCKNLRAMQNQPWEKRPPWQPCPPMMGYHTHLVLSEPVPVKINNCVSSENPRPPILRPQPRQVAFAPVSTW